MRNSPRVASRSGFTLIELLVVIAIIAILIGLLVPAVQQVRMAAAKAQSINNMKQLALACHSYHDQYKKLPGYYYYAYSYGSPTALTNAVTGSWTFVILPFIEQGDVYNATLGTLAYSYSYSYNGQSYSYSYNYGGTAYQASRCPQTTISVFGSPTDPTYDPSIFGLCSYLGNDNVMGFVEIIRESFYGYNYNYNYDTRISLQQITDGTSNTMLLAEGYAQCNYTYSYTYNFGYTYTINEVEAIQRVWNYDPLGYSYSYSYSQTGSPASGSVTYNYTYNEPTYPIFYSYGYYNYTTYTYQPYQVMPPTTNASSSSPQSTTSGGLLVAMCDGSVNTVGVSVSLASWQAAGTPQNGDTFDSTWPNG